MHISPQRLAAAGAVSAACAVLLGTVSAAASRTTAATPAAPTQDCISVEGLKLINVVKLIGGDDRNPEKAVPFKHFGDIYDATGKKVAKETGQGVIYVNPATGNGKEMVHTTTKFKDGEIFAAVSVAEEERPKTRFYSEEAVGISGRYRGYVGTRTIEWIGQQPFDPLQPQPYNFFFKGCKQVRNASTPTPTPTSP